MLGITKKDTAPIYAMVKKLHPDFDPESLGMWGIVFLCCGAMAGRSNRWLERIASSSHYIRPNDLESFIMGEEVCTSDNYAENFSKLIKEWCCLDHSRALAEKRFRQHRGRISDKAFDCHVTYLALAIMLNSLKSMPRESLLRFDNIVWVSVSDDLEQIYGWPELFFAAGIFLTQEENVEWQKMASAIHFSSQSLRNEVVELFNHFQESDLLR